MENIYFTIAGTRYYCRLQSVERKVVSQKRN